MPARRTRPSPLPPITTVPELLGRPVTTVGELADSAGVVAVVKYRPKARQRPGTVVAVHPAPGSPVVRGSAVQVSVAGPARRDRPATPAPLSFAELENVRAGVTAAVLRASGIVVRVDPVAGAVRVEGDLPAGVAAVLVETFGDQLVMSRPAKRAHAADRNTRM